MNKRCIAPSLVLAACGGSSNLSPDAGGQDAAADGGSSASSPMTLASGNTLEFGLAVDATRVYFTTGKDHPVMSVAKDGSDPKTIATGQPHPYSLFADSSGLYVGSYITIDQMPNGSIVRIAPFGTTTIASGLSGPTDLAADDVAIYSVDRFNGNLLAAKKDGSGSSVVGVAHEVDTVSLAFDGSTLFVSLGQVPAIQRFPVPGKAGGQSGDITTDPFPLRVVTDGQHLFWVAGGTGGAGFFFPHGKLMKSALDGSGASALVADVEGPAWLAVDDRDVFFTTHEMDGSARILRVSKDGGTPVELATGSGVSNLVLDDANVYWLEKGTEAQPLGNVKKIAKR